MKVPGRTHPVLIHHSKVTELGDYGEWCSLCQMCVSLCSREQSKYPLCVFETIINGLDFSLLSLPK